MFNTKTENVKRLNLLVPTYFDFLYLQMDAIGSVIPIFTNLIIAENADRQSTYISRGQWQCHFHIPKVVKITATVSIACRYI